MKYVCSICGEVRDSVSYSCWECDSREYIEVRADEICVSCVGWHDHGAVGDFKCADFESCFEACYSDGRDEPVYAQRMGRGRA